MPRKQKWPCAFYYLEPFNLVMETVVHVPRQKPHPVSSTLGRSDNTKTFALSVQKGPWLSRCFKGDCGFTGATNANELQLLLLYFSPYLSSKYVPLGGKNELFKIHLIHSEVLKKTHTQLFHLLFKGSPGPRCNLNLFRILQETRNQFSLYFLPFFPM